MGIFQCYQWIPHPRQHGFRHQNRVSVISLNFDGGHFENGVQKMPATFPCLATSMLLLLCDSKCPRDDLSVQTNSMDVNDTAK